MLFALQIVYTPVFPKQTRTKKGDTTTNNQKTKCKGGNITKQGKKQKTPFKSGKGGAGGGRGGLGVRSATGVSEGSEVKGALLQTSWTRGNHESFHQIDIVSPTGGVKVGFFSWRPGYKEQ